MRSQTVHMPGIDETHPEIAAQWHPTKNGDRKPCDFTAGSNKKAWWLCPNKCPEGCLHEWEATIYSVCSGGGNGCPFDGINRKAFCYHDSLEYKFPEIAKDWHPIKNINLIPSKIMCGSSKSVWWSCSNKCDNGCEHDYQMPVSKKTLRGYKCPKCSNKSEELACVHKSIKYTHPLVAAQWHPTKNGEKLPTYYVSGAQKKVWWKCPNTCSEGCLHEWEASIADRCNGGTNCPFCTNHIIACEHESIAYKLPEIVSLWHPTKNGKLKPHQVSDGSHKKVWWLCPKKCEHGCLHEWQSIVSNVCRLKQGCPYCSNRSVGCIHSSIVYTHPEIANQWHPRLNVNLKPSDVSFGSDLKVWFLCHEKCKYGCLHEWESKIDNRCRLERECPYCSNPKKKFCIHDSILYTHPDVSSQWHPTKNGKHHASHFTSGSGAQIWWICSNNSNHEWAAVINSRCGAGHGCPHCVNKTEAKLNEYLNVQQSDIYPQFRPDWCKSSATNRTLPFDFCIPALKLIIELDGPQHFKQVWNWDCSTKTVKNDVYKMKCALQQGYSVVRILQEDVWNANTDWLDEKLKPHLGQQDAPSCTYITTEKDANIYDEHKKLMAENGLPRLDESEEEQELVENEIV